MGISFFSLGKFPSMILLNIFSVLLSWTSPSFIPIILRFGLSMVSHISWILGIKLLLDLMFSLTDESQESRKERPILHSLCENIECPHQAIPACKSSKAL